MLGAPKTSVKKKHAMKLTSLFTLLLCLVTPMAQAHDTTTPISIKDMSLEKVSPSIYVVTGNHAFPDPQNRGFMNNPAAIVTPQGVIIVDPGSSMQIGEELLAKVRTVTDKPVIAVFNTHVHGDHWLGNYGISKTFPKVPIYAHERTIERLRSGEDKMWLERISEMTKGAIEGTKPVIPTIGLKGGETLKLGDTTVHVHYAGHAHTDNDIMIEVPGEKVLFFGDVVIYEGVPHSGAPGDASFKGTEAAIESMLKGPSTLFIPGHGHSGGREVPESALRFVKELRAAVTKYYKQGMSAADMKAPITKDLQAYKDWRNFSELGRIITYVYLEVEQDVF